jgi:hypothetical protein
VRLNQTEKAKHVKSKRERLMMKTTAEKLAAIKEKFDQVIDAHGKSTSVYGDWKRSYDAEVQKINQNNNLTATGRILMKEKMTERKTAELMQLSKKKFNEREALLNEIRKEADKIAYANLPPVDAVARTFECP